MCLKYGFCNMQCASQLIFVAFDSIMLFIDTDWQNVPHTTKGIHQSIMLFDDTDWQNTKTSCWNRLV